MQPKEIHLHLKGTGHSGRGVGIRLLTPEERRVCEKTAAMVIGNDGTFADFKNSVYDEGIKRMVFEVTEPAETLEGAAWRPMTMQTWEMNGGLGKVFTTKDVEYLTYVWQELHDANPADVKAAVGKALAGAMAKTQAPPSQESDAKSTTG